jgi:hypothetical protein
MWLLLVGGFAVGGVVEHPSQTPLNGGFRPISEESKRLGCDSGHGSGLRSAAETEGLGSLGKHDLTGKHCGGAGVTGSPY